MANTEVKVVLSAVDKLTGPLGAASQSISNFASRALSLSGVLGGLGGALSVASIAGFVKSAIDGADAMGKMAQQAGVGVEALSGLSYAAKLSGLSTEELGGGLTKLNKSIASAATGSGQASDAFKALGVSVSSSSGGLKSADLVLADLADRFAGMQDGAAKTALAMQLFGKAGAEMIPLLNAGAQGIKSMTDEARRLGLVISEDAAAAAEEFNDNLDRLKGAADGMAMSLAKEALPALTAITDGMANAAREAGLLDAALTGLGGLALWIATDEFDSTAKKIRTLKEEIAEMEATLKDKSVGGRLYSWAFGVDDKLVISRIQQARRELDYLVQSSQTNALLAKARAQSEEESAARATAATEARMRASAREAEADKARKARADLIARYMDRELDAAIKLQEEMAKAYDASIISKRVEAEKRLVGQVDQLNELLDARALAESDSIESAETLIRGIEEETALLGLTNEARVATIALRELETKGINLTSEALDEYKKRLSTAISANVAAKAAKDSAEQAAEAWKQAAADIERSLTDALLRGFESGKDWAENFADTLKNLFSTLVLRPLIQPVASAAAGAVTGLLGSGSAAASGGSSGGASGAGNLASSLLPSLFTAGEASASIGMLAGGIAETLGASSAFAGSLGAAVAAIPVAGWIAAGALILSSFFGGKPSNKAAMGNVDLGTGDLFGLSNMTGDKQASQETISARDATLQTIGAFTGILKTMGASIPWEKIYADIGERDGVQFEIDGGARTTYGSNPDEALARLFDEMLAGTTGLTESVKNLLISFDGVGTEMTAFAEALLTIGDYQKTDPLSKMIDEMAAATRSLYEQLEISKASTVNLADAFDGSLTGATNLSAAVKSQYGLELQLIGQIQQALAGTSAMFGTSIEKIRLDVMDAAGKYDYYRTTADALYRELQTAVDPTAISSLAEQINSASLQAWGLLDASQQVSASPDFIAYLENVDSLTTERLNASQDQVLAMHDDLSARIEAVMTAVADRMMAAANTPVQVAVDVNVDTPANVEVYVG